MVVENGNLATCKIVNKMTGTVEMEHAFLEADTGSGVHAQFRRVRLTDKGTYLCSYLSCNRVSPFNGHYPCSFFASQDPVALESVGLDFLRAEMPLIKNADRHLHEAALANNPPSGTVYKPDGERLSSLGVHEHWNNAIDKEYSRNLGTGNGIELVNLNATSSAAITSPSDGALQGRK